MLGTGLFVIGVGMKFGGVVVGSQARETYDDYLVTADQSRIATLKSDFRSQRRLGDGLSNTADGLMVAGALLAIYSLLKVQPDEEAASNTRVSSLSASLRRRSGFLAWSFWL